MRHVALLVPLAALVLALTPSCAFDWSVNASAADAGHDATSDAAIDAGDAQSFDATIADAPSADANGEDSPAPTADAGDCATLEMNVAAAKLNALACTQNGLECTTTVNDPCHCPVFVAVMGSVFTNQYVAAVNAYVSSGCTLDCSAGCPTLPTSGACIDMASTFQCFE